MKTVVVYKSISGFTRKYAEWIAEELSADMFTADTVKGEQLRSYDCIIFGGSLHAAGINGVRVIQKNLERLADRKIIIFATGASPGRAEVLEEVKQRNFTAEEQKKIRFFYLRGGYNHKKLDLPNRILMTLFRWKIQSKREKTPDEKGMLAAYRNPVDFTKKERIQELVAYVQSLPAQT